MSTNVSPKSTGKRKAVVRSFADRPAVLNVSSVTQNGVEVYRDNPRDTLQVPFSLVYDYSPALTKKMEKALRSGDVTALEGLWNSSPSFTMEGE